MERDGPSRRSALDDIIYYIEEASCIKADRPPTPEMPALILRRLVLSHYILLIEILKAITSYLEDYMRRKIGNLETLIPFIDFLSELVGWNRRLAEYCEFIEAVIDDLGIPTVELKSSLPTRSEVVPKYSTCKQEFQYVHRRLSNLKMRMQDLISLVNATEATRQAKITTVLTILVLIFAPMSLIAALFSMGGLFAPGEIHFWIYWVIALPLTIALVSLISWKMNIFHEKGVLIRTTTVSDKV